MPRAHNIATSLRRRRRPADPMAAYDRLPEQLRRWLATALLPWSPRSVARAYAAALAATGDPDAATARLSRIEARLVARDAERIWGPGHPAAHPHAKAARLSRIEARLVARDAGRIWGPAPPAARPDTVVPAPPG